MKSEKYMSTNTQKILIEKVRDSRDHESWKEFVEIYRPYIYKVIRRMSLSHEEAEDLCQANLLNIWQRMPSFELRERPGSFRSWICQTVRNSVLDYLKREKMIASKFTDFNREALGNLTKDHCLHDIEQIAKDEWKIHISNIAWNKIKGEFQDHVKKTFLLSLKNIPTAEIAEEIGITEKTVYVYRRRVKCKL